MNIKELVLKFGSFHWSNPGSEKIKAGLVARGGDSCSEGRGFESWHSILDGHDIFHIYFVVKNVLMFA